MIYIFNNEFKKKKILSLSFQKVYGIGKPLAKYITKKLGFAKNLKVKDLSKDQVLLILHMVERLNLKINKDLKKSKLTYLKFLIRIKSYRGLRRLKGLPVRGQRTRTNAKTCKKIR